MKLVVLPISPWSERARWALDHHGLAYDVVAHVPFLGERRLRALVGRDTPRATVPVLVTGSETLRSSWDIACYADREGRGDKLIEAAHEAEIRQWEQVAECTLSAGRARVVAATSRSPRALDEGLPARVPPFVKVMSRPLGRYAMRWFARKYRLDLDDLDAGRAEVRNGLLALREALRGRSYLLGSFSYADIVMASCLQGIAPVADRYLPLGPETRKVWTDAALASDFADLVAWRDQLYARHRAPTLSRATPAA